MTLELVQERVDEWIRGTGGGYWGRFEILAHLTDELSAALQRDQGLRPRKAEVDVASEIGDVLFTLAALANVADVRLDEAFEKVLAKYDARDGQAWRSGVSGGAQ